MWIFGRKSPPASPSRPSQPQPAAPPAAQPPPGELRRGDVALIAMMWDARSVGDLRFALADAGYGEHELNALLSRVRPPPVPAGASPSPQPPPSAKRQRSEDGGAQGGAGPSSPKRHAASPPASPPASPNKPLLQTVVTPNVYSMSVKELRVRRARGLHTRRRGGASARADALPPRAVATRLSSCASLALRCAAAAARAQRRYCTAPRARRRRRLAAGASLRRGAWLRWRPLR